MQGVGCCGCVRACPVVAGRGGRELCFLPWPLCALVVGVCALCACAGGTASCGDTSGRHGACEGPPLLLPVLQRHGNTAGVLWTSFCWVNTPPPPPHTHVTLQCMQTGTGLHRYNLQLTDNYTVLAYSRHQLEVGLCLMKCCLSHGQSAHVSHYCVCVCVSAGAALRCFSTILLKEVM